MPDKFHDMPETEQPVTPNKPLERAGSFDCPACGSDATGVSKNSPGLIVSTDLSSHYVRARFCKSCGATWQTVESIVVGSVLLGGRQ